MPIQHVSENQVKARAAGAVDGSSGNSSGWTGRLARLTSEQWRVRFALILMFGLYVRTVGFAPVYDDNIIGPWTAGWRDIPHFFAHDIFGSVGSVGSVYYRPLATTWACLFSTITGGAPGWMHLGAIFLYLAGVMLAYVFGRQLFRDDRMAFLTALLFGLHPSKVESTAWIGSSVVDGFGGVLFFASLITFMRWREDENGRWLAASVALFTCAMFTKETMVFIPMLIVAFLWLTMQGALWQKVRKIGLTLLPYGVVWSVYMAIRHEVIRPASAVAEYVRPTYTHANLWTAPFAVWWYIRHLVMPWGLSVEYMATILTRPTLRDFWLPGAGLVLLAVAAWWLWRRQRSPIVAFLLFWFVLTLGPQVVLAPMVLQHDRYLYLPSYAFCALIAWMILHVGHVPNKVRVSVALVVVALWSGLTWHEMGYWDCDQTLWARVLELSPSSQKAQIQLAVLYKEGHQIPKALKVLDEGLRYHPNSLKLWIVRADILASNKQLDESRAAYLKVLQLSEPAVGQQVAAGVVSELRANAAYELARLDLTMGNLSEAEKYARTAVSLDSTGVGYHSTLARILDREGRVEESKAENSIEFHLRVHPFAH
jgi:hypothetical protein